MNPILNLLLNSEQQLACPPFFPANSFCFPSKLHFGSCHFQILLTELLSLSTSGPPSHSPHSALASSYIKSHSYTPKSWLLIPNAITCKSEPLNLVSNHSTQEKETKIKTCF